MIRSVTKLNVVEKPVANGNWDANRLSINKVIIHTMVGTAASANSRFNNPSQKVSAHYGVLLDGTIWQWVDEDYTAYHAGDYLVNQSSIGIEHEDKGDYNGIRTDELYTASAKLVRDICNFYNIPIDRKHILKHSEVHATGCPDALNIDRIVREAAITPLSGLSIDVGYDPTFEGQDVTVNGVHYKSIKVNNVLVWKVEATQTVSQTPTVIVKPPEPVVETSTPAPTVPTMPITPVSPSDHALLEQILALLNQIWVYLKKLLP